ncbi:MAG: hypothetical protein Q4F76_01605 [Lachnospiraceae bacterium]|nr:hypothetical protein [Lachnospiraceae bacterium]
MRRKRRYLLAAVVSVALCSVTGCSGAGRGPETDLVGTLTDAAEDWLGKVADGWQRILSKEDRAAEAVLGSGDEAEVLAGYQKLTKAVDEIMEAYETEDGSVTAEEAAQAAEEIYQYGCGLEEDGAIQSCIRDEDANSVTMVLDTGGRILFAPHVKDTYSGSYSVSTVNAVGFGETVPVAVVYNGGKSVKDYGEYTLEMMEECEDWSHLDDQEVSVRNVRDMLADVSKDNCRLIYWRGHGCKSDGKSVLALAETINAETSQEFSEDIEAGILLAGDSNYWITPEFVEKYMSKASDGGLFFCGSCFSAADDGQLARAFLDKGFQAYVGASDLILNIYSDNMMKATAEYLCTEDPKSPGETIPILEALLKARQDKGETDIYTTRFLLYERVEEASGGPSRMGLSRASVRRTDNLGAVDRKALAQSRTVEEFRLRPLEIDNNGSTVVQYQGDDYYWKYTADSVYSDGLFAYFSPQAGANNQMICRRPDGSEEVLFTADGNGDIYIAGQRMYLKAGDGSTFSVKLDGSDRRDYGYFTIWGADPGSGLVVGTGGYQSGVQAISGADGSISSLISDGRNYVYGGTEDNFVYFSVSDGSSKELALYRYQLGSQGTVQQLDRFTLSGELLEPWADAVTVTQVSHLGNQIYYSYGFYAGTGGFFQEGGINCVQLDENGSPVGRSSCVDSITAEEFLAEQQDGTVRLYYNDEATGSYIGFWDDYAYNGCKVKDMSTGQVSGSSFRLSRPGSFVYLDGAVCMINENQASYTTVIPASLLSGYGCTDITGEEAQIALVRDLEIAGPYVYYTVETSTRDRNRDMGWRPGYYRNGSTRYRLQLGSDQAEVVFSY